MSWKPEYNDIIQVALEECEKAYYDTDTTPNAGHNFVFTAAIAARDKWWVEQIEENVFGGECYILRSDDKATCDKCGQYKICHKVRWQQLKEELEGK